MHRGILLIVPGECRVVQDGLADRCEAQFFAIFKVLDGRVGSLSFLTSPSAFQPGQRGKGLMSGKFFHTLRVDIKLPFNLNNILNYNALDQKVHFILK